MSIFNQGTGLLAQYLHRERFSLKIKRYPVYIAQLPLPFHGFTILQLSDLHDKEFGGGGKMLLDLLEGELFDITVLTGDLVLGPGYRLTPALDLIEALKDRPIYSVSGNHDWGTQGNDWELGEAIKRRLEKAGARVLSNQCVRIELGDSHLWLAGVDDPVTGKDRLERALSAATDLAPRLLLSHSPHLFPAAVRHKVDLLLAGHTHGGQIRLPGLRAAYAPHMGFFPSWDYGLYRCGSTTMIVNGGLGESWLPVRWNMRPEVALITLCPQ